MKINELPDWSAEGIRFDVQSTGHPDYTRVFVIRQDGCTIGRMTFHRGSYDHVKWYKRDHMREFDDSDYVQAKWEKHLRGASLDRIGYEQMRDRCIAQAQQGLHSCRAAREQRNRERVAAKKKPIHRRLTGRNPRIIFRDLLQAV